MMRFVSRLVLLFSLITVSLAPAYAQKKLKYPKPEKDKVYDAVEKPAIPVGGLEAYGQYLADHQNYPTAALQRGVQGTVTVSFVVEKSGDLTEVAPIQPGDADLDREAVRTIQSGPKWTPAMHKGAKVRQRMSIPITFQIPADAGSAAAPAATTPAVPTTSAAAAPASVPAETSTPTVIAPDQPARPVGGTEAFFAWIQQNQKYPSLARQRKVEGRVIMEFIVQKDGTLTDIKPVKRIGSGCDEEAIRLLKAAPKWAPASYKGQPIKQKMVLPVVFQL
ncbi:energy transducer TonB [Hymenobacter sp. BT730]|uniref:energy transducer TonB n=1 Tax=Hymenobacter sp. BT730 TaxID=3063332 RepID=UPI0026DF1A5D|nr:energy transducer TonB [Hymenobacter sp. BT730]